MRIVIYNTNSFGGNKEYSKHLAIAYRQQKSVTDCVVLSPPSSLEGQTRKETNLLMSDVAPYKNRFLKKLYFLLRSIVNPLRLRRFLRSYPESIVIFNDYDQLTSVFWVPLFRNLRRKHLFVVILHDPDRDLYFPLKRLSAWTMTKVMSIMDIALFHEVLPDKPYYRNAVKKLRVPHGIYFHDQADMEFSREISRKAAGNYIIAILGNIREEKNYELAIEALQHLPGVSLLIAGIPSNSRVNLAPYQQQISNAGLTDRVIWVEKFLTDEELQSAIRLSDIILLCYKPGFSSQSGILNLIAPHRKNIIVSDVQSALKTTVERFQLGAIIPNKATFLVTEINNIRETGSLGRPGWELYLNYASWNNHVQIALDTFRSMVKTSRQ